MGFFSWKTQDTGRSISNSYSSRGTFSVTMTDHLGNKWHEDNYEGYGVFGGKDIHELIAEMNGFGPDREKGIELECTCSKLKTHIEPNLTESTSTTWENKHLESCEFQGFFY